MNYIEVMKQAREALVYHTNQTRPLHTTDEAIKALTSAIEAAHFKAEQDKDSAKRLRRVANLISIGAHVPDDDAVLWEAAFAVLGQIARAIEAAQGQAVGWFHQHGPVGHWEQEFTPGEAEARRNGSVRLYREAPPHQRYSSDERR